MTRVIRTGFPLTYNLGDSPDDIYSDHLPIKGDLASGIVVLSLNTLGPGACSGFFSVSRGWETEVQSKQRYERIVKGLVAAVNLHNANIICLQETHCDFIAPFLQEQLGEKWQLVPASNVGMLTAIHTDYLKLTAENLNEQARVHTLTVTISSSNQSMLINNVWSVFCPFPEKSEKLYRELLVLKDGASLSLVAGDTNSRIAPIDSRLRNIATGVIPLTFNALQELDTKQQRPDFPDGMFICTAENGIHQVAIDVLDFKTGAVLPDENDIEALKSNLKADEFRMVLCIDDRLTETKISGKSIFKYQAYLRQKTGSDTVLVRIAANSVNEKAIAIKCAYTDPSRALFSHLHEKLGDKIPKIQFESIESESDFGIFPCLFVPLTKENIQCLSTEVDAYFDPPKSHSGFFKAKSDEREALLGGSNKPCCCNIQ